MTTVTLLAGERTIGGTQIAVEENDARILFDCGMPFGPATNPFGAVRRRSGHELADLIALGLAPYVDGLYAPEYVAGVPTWSVPFLPRTNGPEAVFLSHSHLDHSQLAGFVRPEIPVYASEPAARIVEALRVTGASLGGRADAVTGVPDDRTIAVGPMTVRFLPVDHDVCGARGMLIETGDGIIAYSGDLRLHGAHPDWSLGFAQAARAAGARLLILEGTRLALPPEDGAPPIPAHDRIEADVAPDIMASLEQVPGKLGIVLLTPENGERVAAIGRAANAAGRSLALDQYSSLLATAALGREPDAPYVHFVPGSGETCAAGGQRPGVSAAEIRADPGAFLLCLHFHHLAEVVDIVPAGGGGMIISSNGTPLGPFDPAWKQLEGWAAVLGMEVVTIASTGHAAPHDLGLIAAHSGAPVVMSIHSRFPELMPVPAERLLLPERNLAYNLAALG